MNRVLRSTYRYWIFDLDGTLTRPIFDFPKIKRNLGLPMDRGILEVMAEMAPEEAAELGKRVEAVEMEMAGKAEAARGALVFLEALAAENAPMGILTRNKKVIALHTLEAIGMAAFFPEAHVLGRDEAAHKPSPAGIHHLLQLWSAEPRQTVMVGDFLFDLQAGRAAGVGCIHVDAGGQFPYGEHADLSVTCLDELLI